MLFLAEPTMTIVGEADSGEAAVEAVQRLKPDVVIMDVAMPGMNGIEATRRIKAAHPETAVLALTMYEDEQYFFEMLHAGASGYIPKRAAPDDLVSAIKVVPKATSFSILPLPASSSRIWPIVGRGEPMASPPRATMC